MATTAILLAAGTSSRMGRNKLLLPWGETSLVRHLASILVARVGETIVVLGHEAEVVRAEIEGLGCRCVFNPRFEEGIGSSIAAGVRSASQESLGYVVVLGDMPRLSSELIGELLKRADTSSIVVPRKGDRCGNPVLFGSSFRNELEELNGDKGARSIVEVHRDSVRFVEVEDEAVFHDWDVPSDL